MSPFFNNLLNSFFVQDIDSYGILPLNLYSVSISAENWLTFVTIAISQPIDFSNRNFFKSLIPIFSNFFIC